MCFVEHLTLRTWWFVILPHLLWRRARGEAQPRTCDVFEGSRAALVCARATARLTGVSVDPLRYRLLDVRDEQGLLLRLRIAYQDLAEAQAQAMEHPAFQDAIRGALGQERLPSYLSKTIATIDFSERGTLWRALMTVQVCVWKSRQEGLPAQAPVLFMERLPWFGAIARYAARWGLIVLPTPAAFNVKQWVRRRLPLLLVAWLRYLKARRASAHLRPIPTPPALQQPQGGPRVAVSYYGYLNLHQPERYSDLFFWQQSSLSGKDVLMAFALPNDPLDEGKWAALAEHGIGAIALSPQAATRPAAPIFLPSPRHHRPRRIPPSRLPNTCEARWLTDQVREYWALRDYWAAFFSATRVKVYLSWFKYDATHCPIADALRDVGGLMAIYQRAYEGLPSAETAVDVDVLFGFSQASAEVERQARSRIPYFVTTGYFGDHRFGLLRAQAQVIRERLQRQGAQRILAFTDENSHDEERWALGHVNTRANYAFLLERLLREPWLGLIVKPKRPANLRRRLGPVADLLARAEATGRCFVYEEGIYHGAFPPVAAALGADVMIHGHLSAATAGLESALAGIPTLLMDREGWSRSPLYHQLGVGRVVFTEWEALWTACREHWGSPRGAHGFGDWSLVLDELDPFRDGRAAERVGTYIQWLLDGFRSGLGRETVMADAAQRYAESWGKDKVQSVNMPIDAGGPPNRFEPGAEPARAGAARS